VSLVSDALRKAQVETAQRDRLQHRFYLTHGGRSASAHPRMSRLTVVLSAVLGGCVTAGVVLFYLLRVVPASAVERAAVVAPPAEVATAPAAERSVPEAERSVPEVTRRSEKPPAPAQPRSVRQKAIAETRTTEAASPVVAQAPAPPRRTSRDSFVAGETYVSPIRGPMGIEIALSGISSARGDSVAIINGTLMRRGSVIGPFLIEEIEPRRVRLRYVDVSFWLTY
jgi:hypothetical protein